MAELITTAQTAEGEAKQQAQNRAVELILKLWTNRRVLPIPADPLHGHLAAIKVLSAMLPTADPWRRYQGGSDDALLSDMFGALVHLVMSGLTLTRDKEMRKIEDAEWESLSEEERFLVDILDRWRDFFVTAAPEKISFESFYAKLVESNDNSDIEDQAANEDFEEPEPGPDQERERRTAILAHVETFQTRLADLIERWRAAGGLDRPAEDPDDDE